MPKEKNKSFAIPKLFFAGSLLFVAIGTLFVGIRGAAAATLYVSPYSGSYAVGSKVTVGVYVSSNEPMNAAEGAISFSKTKLQVNSISKSGSIINLWTQEPTFNNTQGTVNFSGIVFNPGFSGNSGKLLTITFTVKNTGTGDFNFTSGSVLANDGEGTNIIAGFGSAHFDFKEAAAPPPPTPSLEPSPVETVKIPPTTPEITEYPSSIRRNEKLIIRGTAIPNAVVTVFVKNTGVASYLTQSDEDGNFKLIINERLPAGTYVLWATVTDNQGLKSEDSKQISVVVKPLVDISLGQWIIIVLLLATMIFQIYIIWLIKKNRIHLR